MATAQDIIEGAIQALGVLGDGDTPTASELADGLEYLNEMLDSWTIDSLMVYQILQETKAITSGTTSITIGTGGDFNTTRPVNIQNAFLRDVNNIDYQLQLLPQDSYQQIQLKSIQTSIPYAAYYDNAFPLGTLYFYPIPGVNFTLYMNSWKQLQQFASLGTTYSLPPGYKEAIRYSLAIRLSSPYGVQPAPSVIELAKSAVARVKRLNSKLIPLHTEVGYIHKRGGAGSFSIYRGY
jgi:hypothetical protein